MKRRPCWEPHNGASIERDKRLRRSAIPARYVFLDRAFVGRMTGATVPGMGDASLGASIRSGQSGARPFVVFSYLS